MLHHVSLEIPPSELERSAAFWTALGFERVPAPPEIAGYITWFEREGTQIHLVEVAEPMVPDVGHPAIVAPDFEAAVARLEGAGYEVERRREMWGKPRAKTTAPGGHVVELMAAPPPSA